jgi:hypothetical protein
MWHLKLVMMIIGYIIFLICKYLSFVMFEHGENGLTIPIDYSPINQLFHKLRSSINVSLQFECNNFHARLPNSRTKIKFLE